MTTASPRQRDTVLVTGASGLLGSGVVTKLRERGTRVLATDAFPRADEVTVLDVTQPTAIHSLVAKEQVTGIVHCGGISGPMVARDNPQSIIDINIGGTANLLEAARVHGVRRLVFCSSLTVYGNTDEGPVPETTATQPTSVYAASKVAGEALVNAYATQHGVDGISLRIGTVYGPGRRTACFIRTLLQNAAVGTETVLPFGRDFPRQYLYVQDAVDALVHAWDTKSPVHRVFNATGDSYLTLPQIAEIASGIVPGVVARFEDGPDPDDPDRQGQLTAQRASDELGFTARWSLAEGIKAYANDLFLPEDRSHD
ncbi:NAD(P)-dependent oxidoreductase [Streptomyces solisilvae]|uniref:NAD-dependent epimerase/dehydratase family protein n=1 Tax=Streptomyces malaysiensis TaxID=92644 RepID=UPI00331DF50C